MTRIKIPKIDSVFINLKYDWAFKRLFGSKERPGILKRLLNAVFEGEFVIENLTFEDKEVLPPRKEGKGLFYDVHCTTKTGFHFIVEMQQRDVESFGKRIAYYALTAVYKQGERGKGYDFQPVYAVVFTDFDMEQFEPALMNDVIFKERRTNRIFTEDIRMIFLSLAQVHEEWEECESELERMMYLIKNMEKLTKDSKPYKEGNYSDIFDAAEVSQMACEDVVDYYKAKLRQDEMEEAVITAERKGIQQGMQQGIEQGMQQGIEQGKEEERIESIRFMCSLGVDRFAIAKKYGLSIEEIDSIANS